VPSVVFWSSGILKESLLIFAMGMFCFYIYRLAVEKKGFYLLYLTLPFSLLILLKFYVFVAFFPAILGWYFSQTTRIKWLAYPLIFGVLAMSAVILGKSNPEYDFISILVRKQHDFINMSIALKVNSAIQMDYLEENVFSILSAVPVGIINSLTRPWPNEIKNFLFVPAVLENILLLVLIIVALFQKKKSSKTPFNFIVFCFLFTFLLYAIIGISTPILGALVRYKIPAMPFLTIAVLAFIQLENISFIKNLKFIQWVRLYL
jgi:hypothetical protein